MGLVIILSSQVLNITLVERAVFNATCLAETSQLLGNDTRYAYGVPDRCFESASFVHALYVRNGLEDSNIVPSGVCPMIRWSGELSSISVPAHFSTKDRRQDGVYDHLGKQQQSRRASGGITTRQRLPNGQALY